MNEPKLRRSNRAWKKRNPGPVRKARVRRTLKKSLRILARRTDQQLNWHVPGRLLVPSKVRAR